MHNVWFFLSNIVAKWRQRKKNTHTPLKRFRTFHWIWFGVFSTQKDISNKIYQRISDEPNTVKLFSVTLILARSLSLNPSVPRIFSLFILVLALGEIQIFVHCYSSSRALSTEKSQYFLLEHLTEVKIFTLFRRCRKIYGFVCVLFLVRTQKFSNRMHIHTRAHLKPEWLLISLRLI